MPQLTQDQPWLPEIFSPPLRADLNREHHLRPISASDTDLDMIAVMGSRERLFSIYGDAWGWPPAGMTHEQDREDLVRHVEEMERREAYNYALFDAAETRLLGCVYVDPPDDDQHDAVVSWWVIDDAVGTELEVALDLFVPRWLAEDWPFDNVRFGVWDDSQT